MTLKSYARNSILFYFLISIPPFALKNQLVPNFWIIFLLFTFLTISVHLFSFWGILIGNKASVRFFLGGTSLKFLIWMIFIFFYLRKYEVNQVKFLLEFFYLYLLNSSFEIYCLLCTLRNQN